MIDLAAVQRELAEARRVRREAEAAGSELEGLAEGLRAAPPGWLMAAQARPARASRLTS